MALQTSSLSSAEHDYYASNSGLVSHAPLNDHKRAFLLNQIPASAVNERKSTYEIELEAIHKYGSSTSNTPPYDAWVKALQMNGAVEIPAGASLNHIKYLFYISGGFA